MEWVHRVAESDTIEPTEPREDPAGFLFVWEPDLNGFLL